MVEALIFDLGGVFLHLKAEQALQQFAEGLPHLDMGTINEMMNAMRPLQIRYERGEIGTHAFFQSVQSHFKTQFDLVWFLSCWQEMFSLNQEMVDLLGQVADLYPCHLLSNTNALHMTYIYQHYTFFHYFQTQILSYEVGLLKPDIEIYQLAAKTANVDPCRCLFIDDKEENVQGARAVGMQAIWHRDVESTRAEFIERRLIQERAYARTDF